MASAQVPAVFGSLAAGRFHTCGVLSDGTLRCWGANDVGQLGTGDTRDRLLPRRVRGVHFPAVGLAAGEGHGCAITHRRVLRCWGDNATGQLGDGTTIRRPRAVGLAGPRRWTTAVSAGIDHTCALTAGNGVRCWGANDEGQVGDGTNVTRLVPVDVSGLTRRQRVVQAGYRFACALDVVGAVRCWGSNATRGLGDGGAAARNVPGLVSGLSSGVAALGVGVNHACVIDAAGAVLCWGDNAFGQLGNGAAGPEAARVPVPVQGLPGPAVMIAAGGGHSCAVVGAAVYCWGWNVQGQLGDGTITDRLTAVAVGGLPGVPTVLTLGDVSSCALMVNGEALCWGGNDRGQLGIGDTSARLVPTPVRMP